jgi:hypothetical protein
MFTLKLLHKRFGGGESSIRILTHVHVYMYFILTTLLLLDELNLRIYHGPVDHVMASKNIDSFA